MTAPEQMQEHKAPTSHRLGNYLLCERLALGGLTEVYHAIEQPSGRDVAIKMISIARTGSSELVTRFRLEARRLAAFRHKHIVPLYAFGEVGDLLYFVMPLIPRSLRDRLEIERRLSPVAATRLALQLASALSAAHARGIVHRDIKPENILISEEGDALLTDFGIARELAALQLEDATWTLSSIGLPVGTPEYMPPEQLLGKPADQRVDVYALGAVLYEMLTGQAPHEGATPWAVATQTLMSQITPPSAYALDIWPALEHLVMSALARQPQDRPADMLVFEEALRDALGVLEEQWETYIAGKLAWVKPMSDERASAPTTSLLPVHTPTQTGVDWSRRVGTTNSLLRPWRAALEIVSYIASDFVTAATFCWGMTNPTYQARASWLRRLVQRHSRSSVERSVPMGKWAMQRQRETVRNRER
jgi:serine/threonine protein kinase